MATIHNVTCALGVCSNNENDNTFFNDDDIFSTIISLSYGLQLQSYNIVVILYFTITQKTQTQILAQSYLSENLGKRRFYSQIS